MVNPESNSIPQENLLKYLERLYLDLNNNPEVKLLHRDDREEEE